LSNVESSGTGAQAIVNRLLEMARLCALSEMACGIAHELNQPLGAIATFAQAGDRLLNRSEPMVGRALDVFRQINTEALAAGADIRRIRELFNPAAPEVTRSQMPAVIEELRPVLQLTARYADTDLNVTVDEPSPDVCIDRLRIQHVIFALVQNAVQACSPSDGPRRVAIAVSSDRHSVDVSVTDSGPGVAESARNQLFRAFFTTKPRGSGLGLASCRAIIDSHGGTIGFDPVPAGGARFWFRVPVIET
jgi:two-component system sensor kinase FixL